MSSRLRTTAGVLAGLSVATSLAMATPAAAEPQGRLSVLSAPRTAKDALPGYVPRFAGERIAADSTRFLGTAEGASHWAAVNASGKPCLVSVIPGKDWTAATTCASARTLATKGIGLQVGGRSTASEAYLVPDGYTVAGARRVAPNLVTLDPNAARPDTLQARPTSAGQSALRIPTLARATAPRAVRTKATTVQVYQDGLRDSGAVSGSGNWMAMVGGTSKVVDPTPGSEARIATWVADLMKHYGAAQGSVSINHAPVDAGHSECSYVNDVASPLNLNCELYADGPPIIPPA